MHPRVLMTLVLAAVLALAALVLVAGGEHGDSAPDDPLTAATGFAGSVLPDDVRAPDFALENQDGELVRMSDFWGEPVIVTFMYAACDESCPPQAQQIKGALDRLGEDVPAVAISVDPAHDTAAAARRFLTEQRMLGRMQFILGSSEDLRPLWEGYAIQPQLARAEHQSRIVLVDGHGRQRVGFPLEQATPERIAHDVRALARG